MLLSLPTVAIAFGAAISLLWAHAIYDTLKVRLPSSRHCTGCCVHQQFDAQSGPKRRA